MLSIIVGLYDDLYTIQQVVEDLKQNGFSEQNMHLATYDERMRQQGSGIFDHLTSLFGREPTYTGTGNHGQDLIQQMTGWGIPEQDAQSYAEVLRRGTSLMMVNASQDQSTTAKRIMDGYAPVALDERVSDGQAQAWQGQNTQEKPFTQEQVEAERGSYASTTNQTTRTPRDFSSFETDFRENYDLVYSLSGGQYSDYEPAYRYGYDLAGMDRYRGRKWSDIEMSARQDWERQHPNSIWDDFKDAIRHGWERVSSGSSAADTGTGTGYAGTEEFDQRTGRYTDPNNP